MITRHNIYAPLHSTPSRQLFCSLALCFMLGAWTSCSQDTDTASTQDTPIAFNSDVTSRTAVDADPITSMGVFCYYTGQSEFKSADPNASKPNFMCNQLVERDDFWSVWTYTPVKYWPNTPGDKLSFFAYAPHSTKAIPNSITPSTNTDAGTPTIEFAVPEAGKQFDLLIAALLMNKTSISQAVKFQFEHVLTQIRIVGKVTERFQPITTVTRIEFKGINNAATIPLSGAAYIPTGSATYTLPYTDESANKKGLLTNSLTENLQDLLVDDCHLYMLPQSFEQGGATLTIDFQVGNLAQSKTFDLHNDLGSRWPAGRTITYTFTYGQQEASLTAGITPWEYAREQNISAQ